MTLRMQESGLKQFDFSKFPREIYPQTLPRRLCFRCLHPPKQNTAYGLDRRTAIVHVLRVPGCLNKIWVYFSVDDVETKKKN